MKGFGAGRHKAAVALMHVAYSNEMIPTMGPTSSLKYVSLQFDTLGVHGLYDFTSLKTCCLACYPNLTPPTLNIIDAHHSHGMDDPAPSPLVISSVSALASQANGKAHYKWHRNSWWLIESASKSNNLCLPSNKRKLLN
jgi:hypothetical protein